MLKSLYVDDLSVGNANGVSDLRVGKINAREIRVKNLWFDRPDAPENTPRGLREMRIYLSNSLSRFVVATKEGATCSFILSCIDPKENRACELMKTLYNVFLLNEIDFGILTKEDVRHLYSNIMVGPMKHHLVYRGPVEIADDAGSFKGCVEIGGGNRRNFYGQCAVNIGSGDSSLHFNAIKLGTAFHTGANAVSVGFKNHAELHSVALGRNCKGMRPRDVCAGFDTRGALSVGRNLKGDDDILVGMNVHVNGGQNVVIGSGHTIVAEGSITLGHGEVDQRTLSIDLLLGHDRIRGDKLVLRLVPSGSPDSNENRGWAVNRIMMPRDDGKTLVAIDELPPEGPTNSGNKPFRVGTGVLHGFNRLTLHHFLGTSFPSVIPGVALPMQLPRPGTPEAAVVPQETRLVHLQKTVVISRERSEANEESPEPRFIYVAGDLVDLRTGERIEPEIDGTFLVDDFTFSFDPECDFSISSNRFSELCHSHYTGQQYFSFDFRDEQNREVVEFMRASVNQIAPLNRSGGITISNPEARNSLDPEISNSLVVGGMHRIGPSVHSLVMGHQIRKSTKSSLYLAMGSDIEANPGEGGIEILSAGLRNSSSICLGTDMMENQESITIGNSISSNVNCVCLGKILHDNRDSVQIACIKGAYTRPADGSRRTGSVGAVNIGSETLGAISNTVSLGKPVSSRVTGQGPGREAKQKEETPFVMLNNVTEADLLSFFDVDQDEMAVYVDVYEETSYRGNGDEDVGGFYYYPRLDTHTLWFDTEEYLKVNLNRRDMYIPLIKRG